MKSKSTILVGLTLSGGTLERAESSHILQTLQTKI